MRITLAKKTQINDKNKINSKELRDSHKENRSWFRLVGVQARAADGPSVRAGLAGPARGPGRARD